ncbi:MAG: hypothetical protein GY781_11255 [Gammaproteobacteria bacterium]|nr:hypothetical protein [Gammaproteobacteria bacterium]
MWHKIKINYTTFIFSVLFSSGCNADVAEINPDFNQNNQSTAFFDNALVLNSANDFLSALEKNWDYPTDLKHKKLGKKTISNCLQLKKHIGSGYAAANANEHTFVSAQSTICAMWEKMGSFKTYKASHLSKLSLNKDFAKQAPASFALTISDEQTKKAEAAANWNEVSQIKKVSKQHDMQSTFYDHSGGIQRLSLMAKGDYNGDGIEDQLLYMENSVEGGSYSSAKAYIITRMSADAPLKLLKEI